MPVSGREDSIKSMLIYQTYHNNGLMQSDLNVLGLSKSKISLILSDYKKKGYIEKSRVFGGKENHVKCLPALTKELFTNPELEAAYIHLFGTEELNILKNSVKV